jgi:hypothetical protein
VFPADCLITTLAVIIPPPRRIRSGACWPDFPIRHCPAASGSREYDALEMKTPSKTSHRERISPKGDTRFVRRTSTGQFKESDDAGKSLAADRRHKAKNEIEPGQGDRGDRRR